MHLTTEQATTFKNAIFASTDPTIVAARAAQEHGLIASYYNLNTTTQIWRPMITIPEINTAIVWSEFAGMTVAKQNAYMAMVSTGWVDATSANIRTGFSAIFPNNSTSVTNLTALAQRPATRFELLFTTSSVCSMFGYVVQAHDVAEVMAS